ncbi:DUF674 domain-containing protein, partial [Tanacetum coccineum]
RCKKLLIRADDQVNRMGRKVWNQSIIYLASVTKLLILDEATRLPNSIDVHRDDFMSKFYDMRSVSKVFDEMSQRVVTYMVMDDVVVKPMSTISSITILNKFNIKEVGVIEEKMVSLEMKKLPLSIVLVGIGDRSWDKMKEFDDNIPHCQFDY